MKSCFRWWLFNVEVGDGGESKKSYFTLDPGTSTGISKI